MEVGKIAKVLQDFLTSEEGELSLQKGDIVLILNSIDKLWCYGCHNGRRGNMPLSYLIPIDYPVLKKGEELFVGIETFSAQQDGDLSFEKGDLIVGVSQVDDNWWQGKYGSKSGLFPTTHTWQLDSRVVKERTFSLPINTTALVLNDMKAQLDEEIDLHAGDFITVLEVIDKNWFRGVSRGRTGVFPAAFVSLVSETESPPQSTCLRSTSLPSDEPNIGFSSHANGEEPSSNYDVFASRPWITWPSACRSAENSNDVLIDDYFKMNASTFFVDQKERQNGKRGGQQGSVALIPYGISLYPFHPQFDNELKFEEGEIITLIRYVSSGWMEGKVNEQRGIFPRNYVNIIVDCCRDDSDSSTSNSMLTNSIVCSNLENASFADVLYNFKAQMKGDLNLREGEVVYVIEIVNESWCKVQNHSGKVGLCPRNYLTSHSSFHIPHNMPLQRFPLVDDNLLDSSCHLVGICGHSIEDCQYDTIPLESLAQLSVDGNLMNMDKESSTGYSTTPVEACDVYQMFTKDGNRILQNMRDDLTSSCRQDFSENGGTFLSTTEGYSHSNVEPRYHPNLPLPFLKENTACTPNVISDCAISSRSITPISATGLERRISDRVPHRPAPPVPLFPVKDECLMTGTSSRGRDTGIPSNSLQIVTHENSRSSSICNEEKRRIHSSEQRQNVISELVMTEKEYVTDLKVTSEVFNLHDSSILENRGIDVKILFGNIFDVIRCAEEFLDKLLLGMKGKDESEQCIGIIFLDSTDKMKNVYGEYCMNHDNALTLLEKYECEPEIHKIFSKGLETLRYQVACFDMSSILIKPVQRILKYPLILNELIKFTGDSHKDKPGLLEAVRTVMDVATYINECKRRKDIVSKYLLDGNATISSKMSRISLHSVAKKSTRLGMLVTSTLGFGAVTKDPAFGECEASFHALEKLIRVFLKNLESFVQHLREIVLSQCYIAEGFAHFYQDIHPDVEDFARVQKLVYSQYFREFESCVNGRVFEPLNVALNLFEGPAFLVQKRHHKFLDYNACVARAEKNKDVRMIQEELVIAKNNYMALNEQLLEELPSLISISNNLFVDCLSAFMTARKLFTAKVMKNYLYILEQSKTISSSSDVMESCCVRYNLVLNQICRLSFLAVRRNINSSPKLPQSVMDDSYLEVKTQSSDQRSYLQNFYSQDMLYTVIKPYFSNEPSELTILVGHLIGVIKKENPMGNIKIWLVDDGDTKGFVPCNHLKEACVPVNEELTSTQALSFQLPPLENEKKLSRTSSWRRETILPSACQNTGVTSNSCFGVSSEKIAQLTEYTPEVLPESEVYYAMYDFLGDEDRTLNVKMGEALKILLKEDAENNPEWWLAENSNGKKGFVPANFVSKHH